MPRNAIAFEVSDINSDEGAKPGAYAFMIVNDEKIGIQHSCPCGCGMRSAMWFAGTETKHAGGPEWSASGEWPKVTLSPSIGINPKDEKGYHWHGYLTNGVWTEG